MWPVLMLLMLLLALHELRAPAPSSRDAGVPSTGRFGGGRWTPPAGSPPLGWPGASAAVERAAPWHRLLSGLNTPAALLAGAIGLSWDDEPSSFALHPFLSSAPEHARRCLRRHTMAPATARIATTPPAAAPAIAAAIGLVCAACGAWLLVSTAGLGLGGSEPLAWKASIRGPWPWREEQAWGTSLCRGQNQWRL
jgi:hypothetical protein